MLELEPCDEGVKRSGVWEVRASLEESSERDLASHQSVLLLCCYCWFYHQVRTQKEGQGLGGRDQMPPAVTAWSLDLGLSCLRSCEHKCLLFIHNSV